MVKEVNEKVKAVYEASLWRRFTLVNGDKEPPLFPVDAVFDIRC